MAKVFLDTNILIDIWERRKKIDLMALSVNHLFASPLSIHIYLYTYDIDVPLPEMNVFVDRMKIGMVAIDGEIIQKALYDPTRDLEDNIQLHSAAEANCDYFLTNDKDLLKMKFFGKTKIVNKLLK